MRQARAIWLILKVREAGKGSMGQEKLMIMQLQLDIKESRGNGQHKGQEEYEALAQSYRGTKCKGELTRTPMYRKALPFT